MQPIPVFFDIAKFADFRWKYANVTRIFFTEGITVPSFIIVRYTLQILGGREIFQPLSLSRFEAAHPE